MNRLKFVVSEIVQIRLIVLIPSVFI